MKCGAKMATRILAVGTMRNGDTDVRVAPYQDGDRTLAAQDFGRRLWEAGASRAACITEDEQIGYDCAEWEAQELEDYLSDIDDRNIWRRGGW